MHGNRVGLRLVLIDGEIAPPLSHRRPAPAAKRAGNLAALIRDYWSEIDAFNARVMDGEASLAECSSDHLMEKMIGVPARGANDALAAMDWIIRHGPHGTIELNADGGLWARVGASLVNAVRDYLASRHEAGLETQSPLRT